MNKIKYIPLATMPRKWLGLKKDGTPDKRVKYGFTQLQMLIDSASGVSQSSITLHDLKTHKSYSLTATQLKIIEEEVKRAKAKRYKTILKETGSKMIGLDKTLGEREQSGNRNQ